MPTAQLLNLITLPATGNESSEQYTFYKVDTNGRADQCTADNGSDKPIGILQNKPAATDRAASIAAIGSISKLVIGEQIDEGETLQPDGTGRGVGTTADTEHYGAIALTTGGAANAIIEVLVTGPQMHAGS